MKAAALILAAGQGTRMKSTLPKVLHRLAGRTLIEHVLDAAISATSEAPVVVVGHQAERVAEVVGARGQCVLQQPQLGTAHAVMAAEQALAGKADLVLVINSDMPLLTPETFTRLIQAQAANPGPVAMLTIRGEDSRGFGRVVRDAKGAVVAVVEEAQASAEQLAIQEYNVGNYCFRADWLWSALKKVEKSPKGEYYITDLIHLAAADGLPVQAFVMENADEAIGINTRIHLADAEALLRRRILEGWMLAGVTVIDPGSTYVETTVKIGMDSVLQPNTHLRGSTVIGERCVIGPGTIIEDTRVGDDSVILASVLEGAEVGSHVGMGPFCHLRKGAHLSDHVHMGNFGEVKSSYLGDGVKMGHFSYIGDATIGENVNIGAGTITCNFDGEKKHKTVIGKNVFIGSDTMLVAPLTIGDDAKTGAGAVVTHDVPPGAVVVGVPARELKRKQPGE